MFRPYRPIDLTRLFLALFGSGLLILTAARPAAAQGGGPVQVLGCASPTPGADPYNPCQWDARKIMAELQHPHADLVTIAAHRGTHALATSNQAPGVPENSLEAIGLAAQEGWESIEIDVKLTSDGIPVMSHDKVWGRESCVQSASRNTGVFDPFAAAPDPPGAPTNPLVDNTSLSFLRDPANKVFLRDTVNIITMGAGNSCVLPVSNQTPYVPTLADVYRYIKAHNIQMVVTLDIQTPARAAKAWIYLQNLGVTDNFGNPFYATTMWKIPAALFPNVAAYQATFHGLHGENNSQLINFNPVFHTSGIAPAGKCMAAADIDDIDDVSEDLGDGPDGVEPGCPNSFGSEANMITWITNFASSPAVNIVALEVSMKEPPPRGILSTVRQFALDKGYSLSSFLPVSEYLSTGDPYRAHFFSSSNGTCCEVLDHFLFNNPDHVHDNDPSKVPYPEIPQYDNYDNRAGFYFTVNQLSANVVTTDDATALTAYLQTEVRRNITYMQGAINPGCNTDGNRYPGCDSQGTTTYTPCSPEGGMCNFSGDRNVAYGANGIYTTITATNSILCSNTTPGLGPDPVPNVSKTCYLSPPIGGLALGETGDQKGSVYCADEGDTCSFEGDATAIIAGGGKFTRTYGSTPVAGYVHNSFLCDVATFPYGDPAKGVRKACFYQAKQGYFVPHRGPGGFQFCAGEKGACQFKGLGRIAYGAISTFGTEMFKYGVFNGGVACSNAVFGDPANGYTKDCFYQLITSVGGATATGTAVGADQGCSGSGCAGGPPGNGADQSCSGSGCAGGTDKTAANGVGSPAAGGGGGNAATFVGSPVVAEANSYNYSPTVIQTGNVQQFWWCAAATSQYQPSGSDAIFYESIDLQSGNKVGPLMVLSEGDSNAWDHKYTCNPKVIKGVFSNPIGDGQTYTYAMYFVATSKEDGTLNSIGVAFSNNGIGWHKYPLPIITYPATDIPNQYGVGQPAAYNSDGGSAIWLFFEGSGEQNHYKVTSTDGVHFSNQQTLTTNGLRQVQVAGQTAPVPVSWGDMAYDAATGLWYAAFNMNTRAPSTTGGSDPERGQMGVMIYKIPNSSLISGDTPWQQVTSIDTNLTGFEGNFIASFLRDGNGNINIGPYPQIEVYSSSSVPAPAWNASPLDRGNSNAVGRWQIAWSVVVPDQPLVAFNRYYNGTGHEVTTGYVDKNIFHLESTLGYLYNTPQGSATTALYGCLNGNANYFVSPDSACEGQLFLGINGYISSTPGLDLVPLYRCSAPGDHFVSTSASCEGTTYEQLLGYAYQPKVAFNRYYGGVHVETTGSIDTNVFHLESRLGYLLPEASGYATKPLYSCLNGSLNYFISPDSACEGQQVLGTQGYAFPNSGGPSIPIYRCSTKGDHFLSPSAACEGQTYEQLLGYIVRPDQIIDPNGIPVPISFNRYYGSLHIVTTGPVDSSIFGLESTLGYLYKHPQGSATKALYSCLQSGTSTVSNYFVSPDSACEGQSVLGNNGYASPDPGPGLIPLYRCRQNSDHFVSPSASCEGQTTEQLLGYVPTI